MSKVKRLIPELRFPEFEKGGEWEYLNGDELFAPISNKNHNSDLPILAITQEQGAIPRELIDYHVSVSAKSVESYKVVEVGDFIISLRSFQGGIEYSSYLGLCSPAYIILRKKLDVNNDFYRHYFKSHQLIQDLNRNLEGIRDGKMISYKQFSDILIPKPLNPEQQKIASCLSSLDELIAAHSEKLDALKDHKKGLLQSLFPHENLVAPKKRFPEFHTSPNWKRKKLSDVCTRIKRKNDENNENVLTISAQDGLISQLEYFNKSVSAKNLSGYYLLRQGEFAYNKSYSKGYPMGAIKPLKKYKKGVVSTLYICFKANKEEMIPFLEHYFESGMLNPEIEAFAQEGARNHGLLNIGINDFFNTHLSIPEDIKEQQKIASCLSAIDELITAQAEKIEQLQQHKKGLMQGFSKNWELRDAIY